MQRSEYIQAFLTTHSFPQTTDELFEYMRESFQYLTGEYKTNLDYILEAGQSPTSLLSWSAPRWAMPGDLVFFYHAGKASHYINTLLKEVTKNPENLDEELEDILTFLAYAKAQAKEFGSCIHAVGRLCSEIFRSEEASEDSHYKGRIFVDIDSVYLFQNPIPSKVFNHAVQIGQSTITPVCGKDFEQLKAIIQDYTLIPDYLSQAQASDRGFYNYSEKTWWQVACAEETRFLHETQLRQYFADDFLKTIKDRGSSLLEECRTFKGADPTGRADYMIQIGKRWYPVETKLNNLAERDLFGQLDKYQGIDSFIVTKGTHKGKQFQCQPHDWVLVLDQRGLYLAKGQSWYESDFNKPWIERTDIQPEKFEDFSQRLRQLL